MEYLENIVERHIKEIQKKREDLIYEKLKQLGININIEDELSRRFKSLSKEYDGDVEVIYYNDGSIGGLRVITFVTKQTPFDPDKMSIGYETSYF